MKNKVIIFIFGICFFNLMNSSSSFVKAGCGLLKSGVSNVFKYHKLNTVFLCLGLRGLYQENSNNLFNQEIKKCYNALSESVTDRTSQFISFGQFLAVVGASFGVYWYFTRNIDNNNDRQ